MTGSPLLDALIAALIGSVLGGGAIGALGYRGLAHRIIEDMLKIFAKRSEVKALTEELRHEMQHRKTADDHIDSRVHYLSEIVQQYIGKIDLLRDSMIERDRDRERELSELREEVRVGFGRILSRLDRD